MASSWIARRLKKSSGSGGAKGDKGKLVVLDGSDIQGLVEDTEAFSSFVESKFHELDVDRDGKLSVKELEPAVADIGAALGLPAQGASPDSDHIYSEVLNEFTRGKQEEVSKSEFKEVLSDILIGMAAGLKRDPIVILRMDGEDLEEFVGSTAFEPESVAMFSGMASSNASLRQSLTMALQQLTVQHGMPPASDPWVMSNIIEPAMHSSLPADHLEQHASQDAFLQAFRELLGNITRRLREHPVIVAHSENTFDGSGIKRLFSNKFELDKLLDSAWKDLPNVGHNKTPKEYIRVALDKIAASVDLPPYGAVDQIDAVINEAIKMIHADDGKVVGEAEFKKLLTEVLGSVILQLEGEPIFVSSNSVVHEPLESSSSSILPPSSASLLATQSVSDQ